MTQTSNDIIVLEYIMCKVCWTTFVPSNKFIAKIYTKPRLIPSSIQTNNPDDIDGLYQLKVDVGMLNTVKSYWADISSVDPSSDFVRAKGFSYQS